ncbi:hypothetical protein [Pelagibacterium xiamenense]|uniref:hypothetical protein n=1 Tax=Pelagibacterium xiamenense TaxID=2901140 RepID=UPI001E518284|nr:hypothetical protein [Pelagibacterium xiamenense]MCD7059536.1 hypothetical protein [Pelagibacterium xiamenense]
MSITRSEMETILGPVDDQMATEILSVGASAQELARALFWVNADEAFVNDGAHMPTGKVAELIEILESAEFEDEYGPGPATVPEP